MLRSLCAVAVAASASSMASAGVTGAAIFEILGDLSLSPSSTPTFNIGGVNSGLIGPSVPPEYDQFLVTGSASIAGDLRINLINGFTPSLGDTFTLIHAGGPVTFLGSAIAPALPEGLSWLVTTGTGGAFGPEGSTLVASVIPAPGALALLAVAGMSGRRSRRR